MAISRPADAPKDGEKKEEKKDLKPKETKGSVKIGGTAVNKVDLWQFADYDDDDKAIEAAASACMLRTALSSSAAIASRIALMAPSTRSRRRD